MKNRTLILITMLLLTVNAMASTSSDELWIVAAGRTEGAAGSNWVTDLFVTNTSDETLPIEITLIEGSGARTTIERDLEPAQTLAFPDIVKSQFNKTVALGALHIQVVVEDVPDYVPDGSRLTASARIYNLGANGTQGQSLDAMPEREAIVTDGSNASTAFINGLSNTANYRSNWFGLNITEDDEGVAQPAEVLAELLNGSGTVIASKTYELQAGAPIFLALSELAPSFDNATLRLTMEEGEALFGASLIDSRSNDPTTLQASHKFVNEGDFSEDFMAERCTFTAFGQNPFFPITPGTELVLEGESDGETKTLTIKALNETKVVLGVTTRVVVETHEVDDKIVEISRNYFAECEESGSVFYFGEDVDNYVNGVVVNRNGTWLAGVNGARPGIVMPGTPIAGSRYFQEIAPNVALDRGEHLATDVEIEVPAGTFERCVAVRDTNAIEPDAPPDYKVYCPGVGLTKDGEVELVER